MTKRSVIRCILSIVMLAYIAIALILTQQAKGADSYRGLRINVADTAQRGFVTIEDIEHELGPMAANIASMRRDSVSTLAIERRIMAMDNIESANCVVLNDGMVELNVVPLIPVARVFDDNGYNYYVNRAGKRMAASPRYRIDVPVLTGRFSERIKPTMPLPVLDYVAANPELQSLVSAIHVTPRGDLMLVPIVKGQVINFGDTSSIADKFARLTTFYRHVLPVKGWEYYDTISVKWAGQVVAKRSGHKPSPQQIIIEENDDVDDEGTMLATADTQNIANVQP